MKNLSVVIDTNVFLVIIPSRSPYHWIYEAIKFRKVELLLSSEIILEYEEQLGFRYAMNVTNQLFDSLLLKENTTLVNPSFAWNLIPSDADDNKFVDCAIAGNADYLITNDSHFNVVKQVPFPKVTIVSVAEFEKIFKAYSV